MLSLRKQIVMFIGAILLIAPSLFAQIETAKGFYDKRQVKPFFSVKGDYRKMSDESMRMLNYTLFKHPIAYQIANEIGTDSLGDPVYEYGIDPLMAEYGSFHKSNFGLNFEAGVQYKQFLTYVNVEFLIPQELSKPADTNSVGLQMWDVKYSAYGGDWMFGWMLFGEYARINLIPTVGVGLSLINLHFAGAYDNLITGSFKDQNYSTLGYSILGELELRLRLGGGLSIGATGGYRFNRYSGGVEIEYDDEDEKEVILGEDHQLDNAYAGVKITYTLKSVLEKFNEKKKNEK